MEEFPAGVKAQKFESIGCILLPILASLQKTGQDERQSMTRLPFALVTENNILPSRDSSSLIILIRKVIQN